MGGVVKWIRETIPDAARKRAWMMSRAGSRGNRGLCSPGMHACIEREKLRSRQMIPSGHSESAGGVQGGHLWPGRDLLRQAREHLGAEG